MSGSSLELIAWEAAQLLGMLALIVCALLCLWVLRPRSWSARPLSLARHELLGWVAAGAALAHALALPLVDRRVLVDYRLSGPRYEWCGLLALLLLIVLTVPAVPSLRRRLWRGHRLFQAQHVLLAAAALTLAAVHALTTGRYLHGRVAPAAGVLLAMVCVLALLRPAHAVRREGAPPHRLVFGRFSRIVAAGLMLTAGALALWFVPGSGLALRAPVAGHEPPLASDFPHDKHRDVTCVHCHHNFTDRSGEGGCFDCHRSGRADLKAGLEARFHDFCLGCHRDPPAGLRNHGPVTGCITCHR